MSMRAFYFPDAYKTIGQDETNDCVMESIVFEPPYTIINWSDKSKTMACCDDEDLFNMVLGTSLCILKKAMGNNEVNKLLKDIYDSSTKKQSKNPNKKKWTIDYRDKNKNTVKHPKYRFDLWFKCGDGHNYWMAGSKELNGCVGQGKTATEAINELALNEIEWIKTAKEYGIPIPKPNSKK